MLMSLSRPIIGEVCRAVVEDQRQLYDRFFRLVVPRTAVTENGERSTGNHQLNETPGELALILNDSPTHLSNNWPAQAHQHALAPLAQPGARDGKQRSRQSSSQQA